MTRKPLIIFTDRGIYCPQADVYIDPWKAVKKALITHGHADHARPGHQHYLATHLSLPIIRFRLGSHIKISGVEYGENVVINGVKITFLPAGHIVGSAQIRLAYQGEIWVVSGDYKIAYDGLSTAFEPVKCHHFITESTFGLPAFRWQSQQSVMNEINEWWKKNKEAGKVSVIGAYSLGKSQRIINNVDHNIGKIFTHGAIENSNIVLRNQGLAIALTHKIELGSKVKEYEGGLVIAPPTAIDSSWTKRFGDQESALASGWMAIRGTRRRRNVDRGFILSDHADWDELNTAVKATEAENIYVTHGYTDIYSKYLNEQGYQAKVIKTSFFGDEGDTMEENDEAKT